MIPLIAGLFSSPALAAPGAWEVTEDRSPLTNFASVSAILSSTKDLVNMIGRPERASLVLRCSDRTLVVYVNWPEVVNRDGENLAGQPKTMAVWRIDDGPIKANLWTISDSGTAAGEFASRNAVKLLSSITTANRLAVRLSGRMTQDAGFDLTGIEEVAAKVTAACGIKLGAP
ncbi:hypothetical protein [Rhizorhapis sp.]|uniref:hypothetical protein n=1 Tax=Rhizorhapis sp. TaxID=1968842 RepID=UPI002B482247|nr:hypothetical protein [Rhizorhapis sp.]